MESLKLVLLSSGMTKNNDVFTKEELRKLSDQTDPEHNFSPLDSKGPVNAKEETTKFARLNLKEGEKPD